MGSLFLIKSLMLLTYLLPHGIVSEHDALVVTIYIRQNASKS